MIITAPEDNDNPTSVTIGQNRCWVQIGSSNGFISAGPKADASKTINVYLNAVYGASMSFASLAALTTAMVGF